MSRNTTNSDLPANEEGRYSRQIRFPGIGPKGQEKLSRSSVLLIGCGALGSSISDTLVRAGIGKLRIVDRDVLELSNLQRQSLFQESDVESGLPKAAVAAKKLRAINSTVEIEAEVMDVTHENLHGLAEGCDLILDGTDNFEIRFLINDYAVKHQIPWVFGGCLGCDGQSMTIVPGQTPCLRCLMQEGPPPAGATKTCDSFGVLAPIINLIASVQCIEAMKILTGNLDKINRNLVVVSLWDSQFRSMNLAKLKESNTCPVCDLGQFEWLDGRQVSHWAVLCGRNAVQLNPPDRNDIELERLATQLSGLGSIQQNAFLLKFETDKYELTIFPDGRAIVGGTDDIVEAKNVYARYVGT